MKNKITIKDIAKEAGVSIATVSYILNKRTDQKISEETTNKVLQIVNLFGYVSSQSARTLASGKSGNIAVYVSDSTSTATCQLQHNFLNKFSKVLGNSNQSLIYFDTSRTERQTNTDAIICFNIERDLFYKIGNNNFVPLIAVDGFINDPLFFQINDNYPALYQSAVQHFGGKEFVLFLHDVKNKLLKEYILSIFPSAYFSSSFADDAAFIEANKHKNFFVLDSSFHKMFGENINVFTIDVLTEEKLNKLLECVNLAVKRLPIENHNITV